jgi:nucleotide-binding universal stress UspA family protein
MFKTIVIATDGSEDSDRAFALARCMASDTGARLVIVHVTELVGGKGGQYPLAADDDQLKLRIESQVQQLRADGIRADAMMQTVQLGGPAHVIAEIADSVDADLIVVGTRGRSPVSEIVLGSVPIRLLHVAHRPLLVVPPLAKDRHSEHPQRERS